MKTIFLSFMVRVKLVMRYKVIIGYKFVCMFGESLTSNILLYIKAVLIIDNNFFYTNNIKKNSNLIF